MNNPIAITDQNNVHYRLAESRDLFPLMRLYQLAKSPGMNDHVFLDCKKLLEVIQSQNSAWIVAERQGEILACFSLLIDRENRLAKINRFYVDPSWKEWDDLLKKGLPLLERYLKDQKRGIEVVYMTTRNFTLKQQEAAVNMGFKILGIFPVSVPSEPSRINALTALFFDGVLHERRYSQFSLHPLVAPFYEIASRECNLPALPVSKTPTFGAMEFEKLPELELIHAHNFVDRRYSQLEERKSLAVHFYPFSRPNALITDANGKVEIYVKLFPEKRQATIIAERLDLAVSPTQLYSQVATMLFQKNIVYIEVINDAADDWGIECISRAGFLPCAYFPCLKNQWEGRRDYVVLARSFERMALGDESVPIEIDQTYLDYFGEYYKLEGREYLQRFRAPQK
jgi:hypothetical protein